MKIEDVMSTDLIVGYIPSSVKDTIRILAKNNVSGMPILKKDTKNVVGVVTRTDIFRNADEDQLALIMSEDVRFVDKDQSIKDAAKLLYKHRIHGLPVINKRKNLVGIVSPADILKVIKERNDELADKYVNNMVVPVYQGTPINIVMEIINITHENALPVLNDDLKLAGIVSDGDLFKLSHIKEGIAESNLGMGSDGDEWTWEGIRDTVRLYYSTSKVDLPPIAVKEVMISDVYKAFLNTPVSTIAEKMIKNHISHMPVVDESDRLIGMVTDIDLMSYWI